MSRQAACDRATKGTKSGDDLHGSGVVKAASLAALTPKKKCCRSKPRCKRCPVVVHKVRKAQRMMISGKDLEKVYKRARKA